VGARMVTELAFNRFICYGVTRVDPGIVGQGGSSQQHEGQSPAAHAG